MGAIYLLRRLKILVQTIQLNDINDNTLKN